MGPNDPTSLDRRARLIARMAEAGAQTPAPASVIRAATRTSAKARER